MILIVGGFAAGKRAYAQEALGYAEDRMSRRIDDDVPVFYGLESQPDTPLEKLLQKDVVICDEIGCGLVPLDAAQRQRREQVGRLCIQLAREADRVIRVVCGVGVDIKEAGR